MLHTVVDFDCVHGGQSSPQKICKKNKKLYFIFGDPNEIIV